MDPQTLLLSFSSAIVGGLIVAFANHRFSFKRDVTSKQREITLSKLVEAWLLLDAASDKGNEPGDLAKLPEAMRLILLFGSDKNADLAESINRDIYEGKKSDWTPLLKSLRHDIRSSVGLSLKDRYFYIHVGKQVHGIESRPS